MIDLYNREFDVVAFAEMPKCKNVWIGDQEGSGCLITALMRGFGFKAYSETPFINRLRVKWDDGQLLSGHPFDIETIKASIHNLAVQCQVDWKQYQIPRLPRVTQVQLGIFEYRPANSFDEAVLALYDRGDAMQALDLVWQLIEKLPNKKVAPDYTVGSIQKQVKEQVCAL